MATTKSEAAAQAAEIDMDELVTVMLPLTREKQDDVFVGLNGKNLLIKRGERVDIPRWAKEILDNSEAMDVLALQRQAAKPHKS